MMGLPDGGKSLKIGLTV